MYLLGLSALRTSDAAIVQAAGSSAGGPPFIDVSLHYPPEHLWVVEQRQGRLPAAPCSLLKDLYSTLTLTPVLLFAVYSIWNESQGTMHGRDVHLPESSMGLTAYHNASLKSRLFPTPCPSF